MELFLFPVAYLSGNGSQFIMSLSFVRYFSFYIFWRTPKNFYENKYKEHYYKRKLHENLGDSVTMTSGIDQSIIIFVLKENEELTTWF
jgi:hypothetical protein